MTVLLTKVYLYQALFIKWRSGASKNGARKTVIQQRLFANFDGDVTVRDIQNYIAVLCEESSKRFHDCNNMCGLVAEQNDFWSGFQGSKIMLEWYSGTNQQYKFAHKSFLFVLQI